jgi:hypothetical protein
MTSELPDSLDSVVRNAALPILDGLIAAGWTFGAIHWESKTDRKLAFSGMSHTGASVFV